MAPSELTELLSRLDSDELRRGKQFEKIVKWWLLNDTARSRNIKTVWLWDEWPDRPGRDIGVDLVAQLLDGSLCAIQAKCFASERDIPKSEIDSFISAASPRIFAQRWLVATTNGLSANARRTIQDNHVTFIPLAELETAAVIWPTNPNALKASKKLGRAKPRPHQQRAIRDVLKGLKTSDKGQLIMACGTGKTLTALWITERLKSNTTLVLVPSLNLLSQTLTEWAHNTSTQWSYICVCSDDTVNKEDDQPINTTVDLSYPVTTKPAEIADFLKRRGPKIVFSTYQSSTQVAKAQKLSGRKFELVICDEAHRLTGKTEADYATVLDEKKIFSKKRLFMTATPRTYTANVKAKAEERGVEITSMDDQHVYGPEFHRLTFGEAIKQELLTDYQVVIVGVTDPQVQELIDRRELVSVNNTVTTDARTLAAHIGLAKATKDFNLARTISFHSRIKTAAQFASDHPNILEWLPTTHKPEGTTWTDTISGDMNTGQRRILLQQLRKDQPGRHALLTNARCLTEGVDVPTLDGVAFIDPKNSQVDIIQAVGRALRKSNSKVIGTIVLTLLLPDDHITTESISRSEFGPLWLVLNALRSHDLRLDTEFRDLRLELGRSGACQRLPERVVLDLPESQADYIESFTESLYLEIIRSCSSSWEESFGIFAKFVTTFGTIRVPQGPRFEGLNVGAWVNKQRQDYRKGLLPVERARRLEQLPNWSWFPFDSVWEDAYVRHLAVASGALLDENSITADATWKETQRILWRAGRLPKSKSQRLESTPGWTWSPREDRWDDSYSELVGAVLALGRPPTYRDERNNQRYRTLVTWIEEQRTMFRKGRLPLERKLKLDKIPGWIWTPRDDKLTKNLEALKSFASQFGHTRVPSGFKFGDVSLGTWVAKVRSQFRRGDGHPLESEIRAIPGWTDEPADEEWEIMFSGAADYLATRTHLSVPKDVLVGGRSLANWIHSQRLLHKTGQLSVERTKRLSAIPNWTWKPLRTKSVP